eukprot:TRINITY_DN3177_c2_g1_i1.p1 TRINITY_DN3177_c2_g1~~TRINITY_DN3177_c2_g1_i1.p1  ORF type:complete len:298 (+),score=114.02 TRINITY_DN3177_c2_g1_i1:45-896(+)
MGYGEINVALRKLEKLQEQCGVPGGAKPKEPEVDTSGMSRYELGQYNSAKLMSGIRDDLKTLTSISESPGKVDADKKAALTNRVRKGMQQMKKDVSALRKDADREGKLRGFGGAPSDYDELLKHMKRTEQMYSKYLVKGQNSEYFDDDDGGRPAPVRTLEDLRNTPMGETMIDPREDEEFQVFFQQTRQRDMEIEEGLDRVHAGAKRLKDHAIVINDQVKEQNRLLDKTNMKAETRLEEMRSLNKKMKQTLQEVEKDKFCCYLICLILVLGILGVLASQIGVV